MLHRYYDALVGRLSREREDLKERLAQGAADDYAAYREMAGECKRLRKVIDACREELKAISQDED